MAILITYALFLVACVKNAPVYEDSEVDRVLRKVEREAAAEKARALVEQARESSHAKRAA